MLLYHFLFGNVIHLFHYTSFYYFCIFALSFLNMRSLAFVHLFYINFLVIMKLSLCSLSFESLVPFKCFFFAFVHFSLVGNCNKCIIDKFFTLLAFVCKLPIVLFLIMIDNFVWVLFFFVIFCFTYNVVCFSNDDDDDNNQH